jgi:hypothetical protein
MNYSTSYSHLQNYEPMEHNKYECMYITYLYLFYVMQNNVIPVIFSLAHTNKTTEIKMWFSVA